MQLVRFLYLSLFMFTGLSLSGDVSLYNKLYQDAIPIWEKGSSLELWGGQHTKFEPKTFPITKWSQHYSRFGRPKSSISTKQTLKKKSYESNKLSFSINEKKLAQLSGRLALLKTQARMSTDDRYDAIEDRRMYAMMLQSAQQYSEMRKQLSLRELNRFQFRRNRQADGVPIEKAGDAR